MQSELQTKLKKRAYEIWQSEGEPEGKDLDHWEQACREQEGGEKKSKPPSVRSKKVKDATQVKDLGTTKKPKTLTRDGP
ncbi:DUF2934 domain-containing protein [Aureimonas fodinaquatilis]|uniref:DUF2934 domain-containing protein n=1 Tax=Aureimonas fodinaquatilis TaxID=2565783 RepID=A0A5B0DWX1_9HYPH|nr:DUF2934 domain-containing protein [Aureimonas fodinaquatilis]KAA0970996.1 DUF2934 domain-containing protein [Aureimonas fodinaquatilis]